MGLLDVRHRLIAALVCRRWLKACGKKMDDVRMTFHQGNCAHFPRVPLSRPFNNVEFRYFIDDAAAAFLNHLGPQLRHLSIFGGKVLCGPGTINCPQLLSLHPDPVATIAATGGTQRLTRLQKLSFSILVDMRLMDNIAPNLTEFYMPAYVLPDPRNYPPYHWDASDVTTDTIEGFIAKRAKTLTSLRLGGNMDSALRIASTPHLTLTNVDMSGGGFNCKVARLGEFFQMQPCVEVLNLWKADRMKYEDLEAVAGLLPRLRVLSVSIMRGNREQEALILLFRLQHLRRLRMEFRQTSDGVVQSLHPDAFSTFASVDLRVLDLSFTLDHESVRELLTRAPALRELKMGGQTFVRDGQSIRTIEGTF